MKVFLIVTNLVKDPMLQLSKQIKEYLEEKGATADITVRNNKQENCEPDRITIPDKTECILVLGGDGTLLTAARDTAEKNIKILGINLGTLGFLAEVEKNHVYEAIDRVLKNEFETEKRMMLAGCVITKGDRRGFSKALNDITITRCGSLQIIRFSVYVNGQFLCKLSADGIIVATPTGSTGYNMSAGGPIVEPSADLIVLTPICAHTLNARSIILSAKDEIEIQIDKGRDGTQLTVEANCDGNETITMHTGDRISIKKSEYTTDIIRLNKVSFLETLHRKMSDE